MQDKKPVARYVIVLDRFSPEDDYAGEGFGESGHNGSAEAACVQVAKELQEAMEQTGSPAGFFNVIERRKITESERVTVTDADEQAMSLGIARRMESD